jgi:alpha-L-fucosidase
MLRERIMTRRSALMTLGVAGAAAAQQYHPSALNLKARQWFRDAKFGLFIHWGVYSVLGDGEWVMNNKKMSIAEYQKLAPKFNPTGFDAAEWVAIAKNAGMKYITITSKHHDGFAMWATKQSKWNIVDATPYRRDPLKMLADECRKQGIRLFFYYSQLDWTHPDYFPRGRTGQASGRPESGDFNRYLDFMDAQLTELLTNYGDVAGIWFDGMWDKPKAEWRLRKTYDLIHKLQPAAMIGSNHHVAPYPGEDFQMFEKDLPGHNTAGFNQTSVVADSIPLETCDTINGAWGYNAADKRFKSTKQLIHYLVRAAGYDANFLLNVGPMPTGKIQPEFVSRLNETGQWLAKNGESIYGTRGGPFKPRPWGAVTQKGDRLFVHILDWQDDVLAMPASPNVRNARLMSTGGPVSIQQVSGSTLLRIPQTQRDPIDTIVMMNLSSPDRQKDGNF